MHDFASHLTVTGLFGYVHHDVAFRVEEQITILTGVNGSGKTHVLQILRSLVSLDFGALSRVPCSCATLTFASGKEITFEHLETGVIRFDGSTPSREMGELIVRVHPDPLDDAAPPYLERIDEDTWIDRSDGEVIPSAVLRSRLGIRPQAGRSGFEVLNEPKFPLETWLSQFRAAAQPTLVETKRLDTLMIPDERLRRGRRAPSSRIRQYVEQVSEQIAAARRASLEVSQRADRQFASRALDKARSTVKESELRRNYQSLAELNQELNLNGLTEASMGVDMPGGRTNPTERRILSVFLEDWSDKLAALQEVHQKLQILRGVVGAKVAGKSLLVEDGEIRFLNETTMEPIRVERLSSGEQHLLALFTMLIFSAEPGTLVLIDEPEISLHAAWKHAFLADIRDVASLNDLQVVLATHSSGIVHGEWDLVEELELPVDGISSPAAHT